MYLASIMMQCYTPNNNLGGTCNLLELYSKGGSVKLHILCMYCWLEHSMYLEINQCVQ